MQMRLRILTPEKVAVDKEVDYVGLTAVTGSLGILPMHAPLAAVLKKSRVEFYSGKESGSEEIEGGFARVFRDNVTVFTK